MVLIEPSDTMYPLCNFRSGTRGHIYKNISLIGNGGMAKIGCDRRDHRYQNGNIVIFGESILDHSLHLENLTIINGNVSIPTAGKVDIKNVLFDDAILTTGVPGCRHTTINIQSSNWTGYHECDSYSGVCKGRDQNKIVCRKITVNIRNSNVYQSSMNLDGPDSLALTVSDSDFMGSTSQSLTSLKLKFRSEGSVHIERTSFEQHHSLTLVDYAMNLVSSAVYLQSDQYMGNVVVTMDNLNFRHNERCLTLSGRFDQVNISDSTFVDNRAIHAAPAILALTSKGTTIFVKRCTFTNNTAGGFPESFSVHLPHSVAEVVHGRAILNAKYCKGIIEPVGRGGAIRVQRGDMVISDSYFTGNEANRQGGSIMVDQDASLILENTDLSTSHGHAAMGAILFSRGRVRMTNVQMVATAIKAHSSMLEHSGNHWSMRIENIYAACPVGQNLLVDTVAAFGVSAQGMRSAANLFDHVKYECEPCPHGLYSLDVGFLNDSRVYADSVYYSVRVDGETSESVSFTGSKTHRFVHCQPCPRGPCHTDIRNHSQSTDPNHELHHDKNSHDSHYQNHLDDQHHDDHDDGVHGHVDHFEDHHDHVDDPYGGQCLGVHSSVHSSSCATIQKLSFVGVVIWLFLSWPY